jgi:hypothetical protein
VTPEDPDENRMMDNPVYRKAVSMINHEPPSTDELVSVL